MKDQNAKGEYRLVEPLDYLILEQLQDEGELFAGYYPLATVAATMRKEHFPELPMNIIATRLRMLNMQELAVPIQTVGSKYGWQRTKKGKELMEAWRQQQK